MYELVSQKHPELPGCVSLDFRGQGNAIPVHLHTVWCVTAITRGQRTVTFGGREHLMEAGWVALIPPGLPHACSSTPGHAFEGMTLCLSPGVVAQALGGGVPTGVGSCFPDPALQALLIQWRSQNFRNPGFLARSEGVSGNVAAAGCPDAEGQTLVLLGVLLRDLFGASGLLPPVAFSCQPLPPSVRVACEFLDGHPQEPLSLHELAGRLRVSPYHLARTFSQRVGVPPHAYQTLARLRLARQHLEEGMSLADTALACGFYDQSHLSLRFKHSMGVTPGQFQRSSL